MYLYFYFLLLFVGAGLIIIGWVGRRLCRVYLIRSSPTVVTSGVLCIFMQYYIVFLYHLYCTVHVLTSTHLLHYSPVAL